MGQSSPRSNRALNSVQPNSEVTYPEKLQEIIDLFRALSEEEKRENLIAYAEQVRICEPVSGETYQFEDVRKDEECTDTVGIFLKVDSAQRVHFRVTLGEKVQTLTKAMSSILCHGLKGCSLEEILALSSDFVPQIVGRQLVRIRSQTVYYVLTRMKSACKAYRDRLRAEA